MYGLEGIVAMNEAEADKQARRGKYYKPRYVQYAEHVLDECDEAFKDVQARFDRGEINEQTLLEERQEIEYTYFED